MGNPRVIETFSELEDLIRPGKMYESEYQVLEPVDTTIGAIFMYTDDKRLIRLKRTGPTHWEIEAIQDIGFPDYDEYRVVERSEIQNGAENKTHATRERNEQATL